MNLMAEEDASRTAQASSSGKTDFPLAGTLLVSGVAGASILFGFGYAMGAAKKSDPTPFAEGLTPGPSPIVRDAMGRPIPNPILNGAPPAVMESGASLALRALGRGTLYAVLGVSAISFGIWKLSGAQDIDEFRGKMQSVFPQVKRNEGRSDFESFRELFEYLSTQRSTKKEKMQKKDGEE